MVTVTDESRENLKKMGFLTLGLVMMSLRLTSRLAMMSLHLTSGLSIDFTEPNLRTRHSGGTIIVD